jgi:hypothetical protein
MALDKVTKWLDVCERQCKNSPYGKLMECKERCRKKAHETKRKLRADRDKRK